MKHTLLSATAALGTLVLVHQASALTCANGIYRAGCIGPNGAAVVSKPPSYTAYPRPYHAPRPPTTYHAHPSTVACARGLNRAGCVGPNGVAVIRRPF
jgi:hypothetical protein